MSYRPQLAETEGIFQGTPAAGTATAAAGKASRQPSAIAAKESTTGATVSTSIPATISTPVQVATIKATAAPQTISQPAMTNLIQRVVEPAERLTSVSDSHVEVQVNLGQGQQVTVRLQMNQGVVVPVFKSASPELRQAIEQNWNGFRTEASQRGLEIATPVFESRNTQGDFDASSNRNPAFQSQQQEPSDAESTQTPTRAQQPAAQATIPVVLAQADQTAPSNGIQIYA